MVPHIYQDVLFTYLCASIYTNGVDYTATYTTYVHKRTMVVLMQPYFIIITLATSTMLKCN